MHSRRRGSSATWSTATPEVTRPIIRGFHVWQGALCRELAPPPADVAFKPPPEVERYTTRELIAHSTDDPTCAGCHTRLNDFAFALENLDPVGRHRETEPFLGVDIRWDRLDQMQYADVVEASHMPVDVQANVLLAPGTRTPVDGPAGLAQAIVAYQAPEVTVLDRASDVGDAYRCLAQNLIQLGYDGGVVEDDAALAVEAAVRTSTVQDAIRQIVRSPDFHQRVFSDPNTAEEL